MKQPFMRIGYSLTLGLALTLAALWLAGSRLPRAGAAGPWFVATDGSDSNGCLDAGDACLTIGAAVGLAAPGDVINIAAGTYTENVNITGKALTFYGAEAATTLVDGAGADRVFASDSDLTLSELTVQNGHAAGGDGGALYAAAAITLTNVNVLSSTAYNLFYDAPTNALTGTHSITGTNPLFVNPAADNYRLSTTSPALVAGVDAGIATDLDGAARGNPPSIGAYELGIPTEANLVLSKQASASQAAPGALITYTLVITNTGPLPATTLQLTDTLSASSTFQSFTAPGGWSCTTPAVGSTGTVACSATSLADADTITFTQVVRLNTYLLASAQITNTATITAAEPDSTAPNTATALTEIYAYQFFFPLVR